MKIIRQALTFDDVLLVPRYSAIHPNATQLGTWLTRNIPLNIPIVSAAMDTVTESELAIAMAREGGIGFIHKNLTIEEQALEVEKVKRYENGMISNPITLSRHSTLQEAEECFSKYKISGLPIVDEERYLVGIVTNRDLKFRELNDTLVTEVMTPRQHLITASIGTTLEEAKMVLAKHRIEKLPIVDDIGRLSGLITIKDIDKQVAYPNACKDLQGRLRCGAAVGVSQDTLERVSALVEAGVDVITIDSAHGHSTGVISMIGEIKKSFPQLEIIGGNIATASAAIDLIEAGVDGLKVGIGPGSICTTRIVAGVGVPQITAIMDVVEVAKRYKIPVIADGGIKFSGDLVKAITAGASVCMIGNLLAGTTQAPGEEVLLDGRRFKVYVGMGSLAAMKRGSKDRYFQSNVTAQKLVPEGIEGRVPFRGDVSEVIYQLIGGIRSGLGYAGCSSISELQENGELVQITASGLKESHPHSVAISKQAPNYNI